MTRPRKKADLRNIGLLILRVGLGIMFILHGYPTMFGGPETWSQIGSSMQYIGIDFAPMFFGFMIGVAEFFGGIFLILGLFFKPSVIFLFIMMLVVSAKDFGAGDQFASYSQTIEMAIVFLSLFFIGSGKYSLDRKLEKKRERRY